MAYILIDVQSSFFPKGRPLICFSLPEGEQHRTMWTHQLSLEIRKVQHRFDLDEEEFSFGMAITAYKPIPSTVPFGPEFLEEWLIGLFLRYCCAP
jgi:hypothetical protein